jgi:hypothetical protein
MYNDGPNALIICFTDTMAQQLIQRDSFELDMSFKRVAGPFNEVVFAAFDEQFNQREWIISDFKLNRANIRASCDLWSCIY